MKLLAFLVLILLLCLAPLAWAHGPDASAVEVPEVPVTADRPVAASSQQFIPDKELILQPQGRSANLLRLVPGLITVEHSGGAGKADQYFLRGFDADHGTDIALFADGMPINLRSHAHGQGYSDLNFIIPETIQGIDVYKGTYHVQFGDFATAGAVNYITREVVKEGVVQLAGGRFDTQRHLLMFSPTKEKVRTLFAGEGYSTNGPFVNDNRYFRFNGLAKMTMNPTARSELSLTGSFHKAQWNASGEIPLRAVNEGTLDRFGAIDPSEGGKTTRGTGRLNYHHDTTSGGQAFVNLYAQYYRLDLFTNFTFFLNDPINGDGIQQTDRRALYGGDIGWRQSGDLMDIPSSATLGVQARVDDAHVRLGTQRQRAPIGTMSDSDVQEASYSPYLKLEVQPTHWLRLAGGARGDLFTFDVQNRCPDCPQQPNGRTRSGIASTKGNLILGPWFSTEVFLNFGTGFHSNDARMAVSNENLPALARATGYEAGLRTKQWDRVEFIATLWALDLQSELVFVGDAGTTQARGPSRRYGTELASRIQLLDWLQFTGSVTLTHAEFRGTGQAIPLAPETTGYAALLARFPKGLSTQLQMLHLGRRPLIEDRNVFGKPFTVFDLVSRYQLPIKPARGRFEVFFSVINLFDAQWRQAQFFFESRLRNEPAGVTDIHFVPGTPRMAMGGLSWYF